MRTKSYCRTFTAVLCTLIGFNATLAQASLSLQTDGVQLTTEVRITPAAASGARFERMNPNLASLQDFRPAKRFDQSIR